MTIDELVEKLIEIQHSENDEEQDHIDADNLLLEFINNEKVTEAFNNIYKWYS